MSAEHGDRRPPQAYSEEVVRVLEQSAHPELIAHEPTVALSQYVAEASGLPSYRGTIVTEIVDPEGPHLSLHSLLDVPGYSHTDMITAAQHIKHGAPLDTPGSQHAYEGERLFRIGFDLVGEVEAFYLPEVISRDFGLDRAVADPKGFIAELNEANQRSPHVHGAPPERVLGFLAPQRP